MMRTVGALVPVTNMPGARGKEGFAMTNMQLEREVALGMFLTFTRLPEHEEDARECCEDVDEDMDAEAEVVWTRRRTAEAAPPAR